METFILIVKSVAPSEELAPRIGTQSAFADFVMERGKDVMAKHGAIIPTVIAVTDQMALSTIELGFDDDRPGEKEAYILAARRMLADMGAIRAAMVFEGWSVSRRFLERSTPLERDEVRSFVLKNSVRELPEHRREDALVATVEDLACSTTIMRSMSLVKTRSGRRVRSFGEMTEDLVFRDFSFNLLTEARGRSPTRH